jgi:Fe-S cluster assembly protein SufB
MARFAPIKVDKSHQDIQPEAYEHGRHTSLDTYTHIAEPGLSQRTVEEIASHKSEPVWMRQFRLAAYQVFQSKPMPTWGGDLNTIDFDSIYYYLKPTDRQVTSWEDVPQDIKDTFDRIGVPEAERNALAGVKAQYDSEVIYGSLQDMLSQKGVIFLSMDEALKKHPDLVKQYFGTIIPATDNKFAALNSAVWSGGSFVYVPRGVKVDLPLQAYFRINAPNAGQFERTLIIAEEGSQLHYVEGCFTAGTKITTEAGLINIEDMKNDDSALTHKGRFRKVYHVQERTYSGDLYTIQVAGNPAEKIEVTEEHPFLTAKRQTPNERNYIWEPTWVPAKDLKKNDYLCLPIDQKVHSLQHLDLTILEGKGRHGFKPVKIKVPSSPELFRLVGYYLAEGSISSGHYLNFSFGSHEKELIDDVKSLLKQVFNETRFHEVHHKTNNGTSVVVRSTKLCRIFEQLAGVGCSGKVISPLLMQETKEKQRQLLLGWYRGDGNYYNQVNKFGRKELFRISTVSAALATQGRQILMRLGIASSLNIRSRSHEGRQDMYTLIVGGQYLVSFANIVGQSVETILNGKKRATYYHIDGKYQYVPIRDITSRVVDKIPVFNFSVKGDESYVAAGVAVHNCTAPAYSSESLHSAVVEIIVKPGARVQYTTVQNWYKTVYNLVTKRAWVEEEGEMVWTDFNMGSKLTMKYPGFILAGKGAHGETLSMALAGAAQHQDTGSKAIHLAPHTSSNIISKSISKGGGRTSYRGLVHIGPNARGAKSRIVCDALLLDPQSRSDTYPTNRILNNLVKLEHEASVSKIGQEQLFYLMSRGLSEEDAGKMIVAGFIAPLVKTLPIEYAVEMNRLIDMEMEGSIG